MTKYSNYYSVRNIRNEHKKNLPKSSKIREQLSGKKKTGKNKKMSCFRLPGRVCRNLTESNFFLAVVYQKILQASMTHD